MARVVRVSFRQAVWLNHKGTAQAFTIAEFGARAVLATDESLMIREVDGTEWNFQREVVAGWQVLPEGVAEQNPNGLGFENGENLAD